MWNLSNGGYDRPAHRQDAAKGPGTAVGAELKAKIDSDGWSSLLEDELNCYGGQQFL